MDLFKPRILDEEIDLDDLDNGYYRKADLEKNWATLRLDCFYQLGYAVIKMDYIVNDIDWWPQRGRIDDLIEELKVSHNNDSKLFWLKLKFRILCEIENLC